MNWRYANHKSGEASICYWAGAFTLVVVVLDGLFLESEMKVLSLEWLFSNIDVFLFVGFLYYCGWLCNSKQRGFSKWYEQLVRTGIKCEGQIVSAERIISRSKQGRRVTDYYRLKIKYFSLLNCRDVYYDENVVEFDVVDMSKPILCDVYETTRPKEQVSYEEGLIDFVEKENGKNDIQISLNPIRLFTAVHRKYTRTSFGNQVATNFRYEETEYG